MDHHFFKSIQPRNLLSFGPETEPIELRGLNLLIGPNGSGKSNLLEVIAMLRACPADLRQFFASNGGPRDWIWKGDAHADARVEVVLANGGNQPLRHILSFGAVEQSFALSDERIEKAHLESGSLDPYFFYRYLNGNPVLIVHGSHRNLRREDVQVDQSILSQRHDPDAYPEVSALASSYRQVRLYREWSMGRRTVFRVPQKADLRNDYLEEDFANLGLVLSRFRRDPKTKRALNEALTDLYDGLDDFDISIEGGTVQVFFTEGDFTIPATRLSDGSLRYLCLLALLLDPEPPPVICLEEPELGLHPDLLPKIVDLLIDASSRTQLFVTTHSEILVDAMTEHPESVLVCEKHQAQTQIRRLQADELAAWLKDYRLGQLWTRGELGGTRW